ncbi:MAG: hypothetical protein HIU85_07875 [Proteobacteria bacterium]|nr:hypothetical protein [Pseudomonadota bacterium]
MKDETPAHCDAEPEKREGTEYGARENADVDAAVLGHPQDDRHQYPPDGVVHDGCGQDDLSDRAPDEPEIAYDDGHDLDRGDRERRADEEPEQEPLLRLVQHRCGQQLDRQPAAEEGQGDAGQRYAEGGAAGVTHDREVRLHAGEQQQQEHPELPHRREHGLLLRRGRKEGELGRGSDLPEDRGSEHDAGEELPHDRRLAPAGEELPQQAPRDEEHHDLRQEDGGRRVEVRRMQVRHPGNFSVSESSGPSGVPAMP